VGFHDASVPFVHKHLKGSGLYSFIEPRLPRPCQITRQKAENHTPYKFLGGDPHPPAHRGINFQDYTAGVQKHNRLDGTIEQGSEIRLTYLQLIFYPPALGGVLQDTGPEHIPICQGPGHRIEMNPSFLAVFENAPIPVERLKRIHGGYVLGNKISPVIRMSPFGNNLRIGFPLGLGYSQYSAESITRHLNAVVRR
jgi:hypothetical protein